MEALTLSIIYDHNSNIVVVIVDYVPCQVLL
jgi:hypothetical protein